MQSPGRSVVTSVSAPHSGPALKNDGERKKQKHLRANTSCGPGPSLCRESHWRLQRAGRTRAAGHWSTCHSLGWQEVDSVGPGSVGRTDGQEFRAASKSAKRQTAFLPSLSAAARSHLVTASCRGPRLKATPAWPGAALECVIPRLMRGAVMRTSKCSCLSQQRAGFSVWGQQALTPSWSTGPSLLRGPAWGSVLSRALASHRNNGVVAREVRGTQELH